MRNEWIILSVALLMLARDHHVTSLQLQGPITIQKGKVNEHALISLSASVVNSVERVSEELEPQDDDAKNLRYTRFAGVGRCVKSF